MSAAKGYYSLVQYCPDLSRLESANVGVLLFCPELRIIRAKMDPSNARIRQFFGQEGYDRRQLSTIKDALERRLEVDQRAFRTLGDLEQFIASRANELQITAPRPMKVLNPEQDLQRLFDELVAEGPASVRRGTAEAVREALCVRLEREGLDQFVERDVVVHVRALDKELEVPFGYRNGRFNLVRPAAFLQPRIHDAVSDACLLAVEGHSLYKNPDLLRGEMQLVVVAQFPPQPGRTCAVVRDIFGENEVVLHDLDHVDALIQHIRQSESAFPHGVAGTPHTGASDVRTPA
ncbi:MAG: DUF3037 domain-containing protein [Planctomycetes bacterium]|nr:DUF3037 domain-containing protein [Planctomycetota bacterium]